MAERTVLLPHCDDATQRYDEVRPHPSAEIIADSLACVALPPMTTVLRGYPETIPWQKSRFIR
jgi:hypothetical protein